MSTDKTTAQEKSSSRKRMQMADIARMAGVSTSTVSRALNGSPLIPEATRARIAELARSLNYTVNVGAANLRKRDVQTVALVHLGDTMQRISDPFLLSMVGHVADGLESGGMNLLLTRLNGDRIDQIPAMVQILPAGEPLRNTHPPVSAKTLGHDPLKRATKRFVVIAMDDMHVGRAGRG